MKLNRGRSFTLGLLACLIAVHTSASWAVESPDAAMKEIAASLGPALADSGLKKLAVVEFTDIAGYRSALGPFLAEELTTQLFIAKPGTFDFVERQQLAKVLEEQKLTSSSLFESGSIASVGKVLGIQAIVTGSMADLGDQIKVNTRVISVESARIVAAASTTFPRKGAAETLMRQSGSQLGGGAGFSKPTQGSDVYFRNELVLLSVESISVNSTKSRINLVLALENLTDEPLYLKFYGRLSLVSATRDAFDMSVRNGIEDNGNFTTFDAHRRVLISMYSNEGEPTSGFYSLSGIVKRWINEKNRGDFSFGISGIRLERVD